MGERKNPRVIKRYANRKLYDMAESCYITHEEIAALVKSGEEIKIIDNRTKEDLTTATLTQILFEKEKRQRKTLPLSTLRSLFQSSGDFIQKHITQPVTTLKDEAEETVRKVFRGRGHEAEALAAEGELEEEELDAEDPGLARGKPADAAREWVESTQKTFENMQKMLEDRWTLVVNSLGHFDSNYKRIAELERRVAALEDKLGVTPTGGGEA